jgi:hypothetical protein
MATWENSVGATDEWYTPKYIFDALGCKFDVDVAAPIDRACTYVPADEFISSDSLENKWAGFIWMNPPFGGRNGLVPWLNKFFDHGHGIALTPDRTSAPWFRDAFKRCDAVMFIPKVRFIKPDGSLGKSPNCGTAIWAAGDRAVDALVRARGNKLDCIIATKHWSMD